jgi:hypothetical protein
VPYLYGPYIPTPHATTIVDVQNFERDTGWVATTSYGEFIPRWVETLPPSENLIGLYAQGEVIPRLQPASGITVLAEKWYLTGASLALSVERASTLRFDWTYFPGFWARVDGERIPVMPGAENGLLTLEVPAGEHDLQIGFGPTSLRLGSMIGSGVIGVVGLGLLFWRWPWFENLVRPRPTPAGLIPVLLGGLVVGLVLLGVKVLWLDVVETPFRGGRFSRGLEAGLDVPINANFAEEFTLLGYDLARNRLPSGGSTALRLFWEPGTRTISDDYSTTVYLQDSEGRVITRVGTRHPGGSATTTWVSGFYVQEKLTITVPSGTPPGLYTLAVTAFSPAEGRAVDVFLADGRPSGVFIELGGIIVKKPLTSANSKRLPLDVYVEGSFREGLKLVGVSALPGDGEVGGAFPLIWYWEANRKIAEDYSARLVWMDNGEIEAASPALSLVTHYPTSEWRRRDLWRGVQGATIPGRLEAGIYEVGVQLINSAGNPLGDPVEVGRMSVRTPLRVTERPALDIEADLQWEEGIRLEGIIIPDRTISPDENLTLTLIWMTDTDITVSWTIFLHLLDSEGNIILQRDTLPANGSRPTTGWAPGEYVIDPYALLITDAVPPGTYTLRIGLYRAETGLRLLLVDGVDSTLLPLTVEISR